MIKQIFKNEKISVLVREKDFVVFAGEKKKICRSEKTLFKFLEKELEKHLTMKLREFDPNFKLGWKDVFLHS